MALCGKAPALAGASFKGESPATPGAPATIVFCHGSTDGYAAYFGADFVNATTTPLKAVRVRFDFYDAFGTLLQSEHGDYTGTFTRGARISGTGTHGWQVGSRWFNNLADVKSVRCSIERTLDVDGNAWTNATLPSPAPSGGHEAA